MSEQAIPTVYFDEPGPQHTERVLGLGLERARALGLGQVVVASDTGKSARAGLAACGSDFQVVVVTNPAGLRLPVQKLHEYLPRFAARKRELRQRGLQAVPCSLSDDVVLELEAAGARVSRIDWRKLQAFAKSGHGSLDLVGVGVRVGLVIAVWACLAELVPADCEVLTLSGTGFGGGGIDTATIVQTASRMRDYRICEVLARPRLGPPSEA